MALSTEVRCITMHEGKVLIGRWKNEPWETPGGEIGAFEHLLEATIREVYEHSGISVNPKNVIFVSEIVKPEQEIHRILIYLYADYVEGDITIREEEPLWTEAQWVDVRELGNIQDGMSDEAVDAFYKFSLILRQSAARSGAQA